MDVWGAAAAEDPTLRAEQRLGRFLELRPGDAGARSMRAAVRTVRAVALMESGRRRDAIDLFEKGLTFTP